MKYRDEILKPPLCLPTHKMEERVKILETYPFVEFYKRFIDENCHVLVTTLYNLNFACQLIKMKENLKYCTETRNMKILYVCVAYFVHL